MFFNIGGNEKTQALKNCRSQCERFLLDEESEEIRDLIHVISAIVIYFETGSKEIAGEWVNDIWSKLIPETNLSFFEIRLLTAVLFTELNIKKVIEMTKTLFNQLEIYKFHKDYMKVKIAINLNILDILMSARSFVRQYKSDYDEYVL